MKGNVGGRYGLCGTVNKPAPTCDTQVVRIALIPANDFPFQAAVLSLDSGIPNARAGLRNRPRTSESAATGGLARVAICVPLPELCIGASQILSAGRNTGRVSNAVLGSSFRRFMRVVPIQERSTQ